MPLMTLAEQEVQGLREHCKRMEAATDDLRELAENLQESLRKANARIAEMEAELGGALPIELSEERRKTYKGRLSEEPTRGSTPEVIGPRRCPNCQAKLGGGTWR